MKAFHTQRRSVLYGAFLVIATVLPSCIIWESDMVAVGTESWRANVVIHAKTTEALNAYKNATSTYEARKMVASNVPGKFSLTPIWSYLCNVLVSPLCSMGYSKALATVRSWFVSDTWNRSDFPGDLSAAARQNDCFAWTFFPSRNFTTKSPGTSGCLSYK